MNPTIPDPDPLGLPAPLGLLKFLLVFTFILHLIPMNLVLGGGFLALASQLRAKESKNHKELARVLTRILPIAVAFTITLGVAPLLFLQVAYGQAFYTSSVLMAWPWLAIIGLIILGYYGYYWLAFQLERLGARAAWVLLATVAIFALVGFIFTNNMVLMLTSEKWYAMYTADNRGLHWNFDDPTVIPRFLHFVVASLAFAGLAVAILGRFKEKTSPELGNWMRGYGAGWFIGATLVQFGSGLWFLFSLPERVRTLFLGGSTLDTGVLIVAVVSALAAIATVGRKLWLGGGLIALTIALMAVIRHRVRSAYLDPHLRLEQLLVEPQTTVFLIFGVLLIGGLALIGWMLWRFANATEQKSAPRTSIET